MAGKGLFDPDLVSAALFDEAMVIEGWYDKELIDSASFTISRLYLRNTTANGISIGGVPCYDLLTTAGSSADTSVVNTTASGTEIQFTKTAGGSVAAFITGRAPLGGWTITSSDVALWLQESAATVNAGLRFRLFKYSAGTETELGGSPFGTGTEFNTANTLETLVGNVTDTALAEDDRLLLRIYAVNVGTMAAGTATLNFNGDTTTVSSPAATYIGEATLNFSGSTSTATAANIGTASANRRVVASCQQGTAAGRTLTSATIGGISARIEAQCTDSGSNAGAYIISAVVPTGTTADIVMTFSSTIFAGGTAHVYTVDDTTISSTVNAGTNTTAGATSLGVSYTSTNGGVTIGTTDWNNGTGKTPVTVTGYTTDMADSSWVAFRKTESASGSQTATTAWSGSFGAASAVVSYAPVSTTTYGNSYLNVYPLVTFKAEGGGAQTLLPSLITDTDSFFSHTVAAGSVNLSPALFTDTDTFFTHSLASNINLSAGLFADSDTFFTHSASTTINLTASLFADSDAFYSAMVAAGAVNLQPGLFTDADTFYAATISQGGATQNLTASLFTSSNTFYAHTLNATIGLTPSLYTDSDTFYAATVATSITLTPALYTDSDTFYSASLTAGAVNLTPSLFTDADTFYAATLTQAGGAQTLLPSLYDNADTFYSATVTAEAVNLTPSLFTDADGFFSASLTGAITVSPALYTDTDTFYAASVASTISLAPALFTDADNFFSATLSQAGGGQTLTPSLYVDADTFYAAAIAAGAVTLQPARVDNGNTFYGATVSSIASLEPSLYIDADTFYAATLTQGAADLHVALFTDADTFYVHLIVGGDAPLQYPLEGVIKHYALENMTKAYPLSGVERDYPL